MAKYQLANLGRATCAMAWRIKRYNPDLWDKINKRAEEIERKQASCGG